MHKRIDGAVLAPIDDEAQLGDPKLHAPALALSSLPEVRIRADASQRSDAFQLLPVAERIVT
jgi:hypothetical protein